MVDLEAQGCKINNNLLSFEKDKVYCVKVHVYDFPKKYVQGYCAYLVEEFKRKGVELIALPIIDREMDLEFFKINNESNVEKSNQDSCIQ